MRASDVLKEPAIIQRKIECQESLIESLRISYSGQNPAQQAGSSAGNDKKMLKIMKKIEEKEKKIKELRNEYYDCLDRIDAVLEHMQDEESKVLIDWYILKMPKNDICKDIGYSERNMWRIKKRALESFEAKLAVNGSEWQ